MLLQQLFTTTTSSKRHARMDPPSINDEFSSLFLPDLETSNQDPGDVNYLSSTINYSMPEELQLMNSNFDDYSGSSPNTPYSSQLMAPQQPMVPANNYWQIPQYHRYTHYSSMIPIEATINTNNFYANASVSSSVNNNNSAENDIIDDIDSKLESAVTKKPATTDPHKKQKKQNHSPKEEQTPNEYTELLDFNSSLSDVKLIDFNDHEILYEFNGYLNGKFFTNEESNNSLKYISCYRRNYIQINFQLNFNNQMPYKLFNNDMIKSFKISIYANINISNDKIDILIFEDRKHTDMEKDVIYLDSNELEIPIKEIKNLNSAIIKKLQFKNATPNNGKLNFQNYYHLILKLSCITENNEIIELSEIRSKPIIVRGRNPSFYTEKNDVLIPNKNPSLIVKSLNNSSISGIQNVSAAPPSEEATPEYVELPKESSDNGNGNKSEHTASIVSVPSAIKTTGNTNGANSNFMKLGSSTSYKYFPISSAYYLPPIQVLYFPHAAHHPRQSESVIKRRESIKNDRREKREVAEAYKKNNVRNYYFTSP